MSDAVTRLNAALEGRYAIERGTAEKLTDWIESGIGIEAAIRVLESQ